MKVHLIYGFRAWWLLEYNPIFEMENQEQYIANFGFTGTLSLQIKPYVPELTSRASIRSPLKTCLLSSSLICT